MVAGVRLWSSARTRDEVTGYRRQTLDFSKQKLLSGFSLVGNKGKIQVLDLGQIDYAGITLQSVNDRNYVFAPNKVSLNRVEWSEHLPQDKTALLLCPLQTYYHPENKTCVRDGILGLAYNVFKK